MTAKEALELAKKLKKETDNHLYELGTLRQANATFWENGMRATERAFNSIIEALSELEAIKSADGGEALEVIKDIEKSIKKHIPQNYLSAQFEIINNYILKAQAKEKELAELKKSDESKEQSSIDYYNEMRKYKRELAELKKTVMAFIDNHVAYPYDEDAVAYDDEYTKDYERLLELCKGSEE